MAHVRAIKRPGAIRLVNLAENPAHLEVRGARLGAETDPGKGTIFLVSKAGKGNVVAKSSDGSSLAQLDVEFKPSEGVSLYVLGKDKFRLVEGEPRSRTEKDLQLVVVNLTGGAVDVSAGGASLAKAVGPGLLAKVESGKPGDVTFELSGEGKKATFEGSLVAGHSYSLALYERNGKLTAELIQNSPNDPAQAGSARA